MIAFSTVLIFAVVQSLFGMGLLVFGTPTLVLLGFSFSETLATLLPASIIISFIQVMEDRTIDPKYARQFVVSCLPPMVFGLAIHLAWGLHVPLELALGAIMFAFATLQLRPELSARARMAVQGHSTAWMVAMGLVHGLSNLGGSVLSVVAGALFTEKTEIRRTIAFSYLCFATIQIPILVVLRPGIFDLSHLMFMALAGTVYLLIGRRTFRFIPQIAYERLFIGFMLAYAFVLFGKGAGLI